MIFDLFYISKSPMVPSVYHLNMNKTKLNQTKPNQTKPNQTKPNQTKLN